MTLRKLDAATGQKVDEIQLQGSYQFPNVTPALAAVSSNGAWVALSRWDGGIKSSHFAVVDGNLKTPPMRVDLNGYWQVDALSNDGRWLYLIENLTPPRYKVRLYGLAAGTLNPTPVIDPHEVTSR